MAIIGRKAGRCGKELPAARHRPLPRHHVRHRDGGPGAGGAGAAASVCRGAGVLAILLGIAVRTLWSPDARFRTGIAFSAKQLLEVAVVLLGASLSLGAILASGPALLAGIVGTVAIGIGASIAICRVLGLPPRMAILVACGNAICGNSAIAAVAPVIGADSQGHHRLDRLHRGARRADGARTAAVRAAWPG